MYNRFFLCKKTQLSLLFGLLLPLFSVAQTEEPLFDRLDQWMRRMDDQMRRAMPFDSLFNGGRLQVSPDSNTFFYFRIDTSFGGNQREFFDFSPFENFNYEEFFGNKFPGFDNLFDNLFSNPFSRPNPRDRPDFPADDGNQSPDDDNLLPEERLRQQEEKTPAKKPEPKVKTIRI
jgi:hypothetical protein